MIVTTASLVMATGGDQQNRTSAGLKTDSAPFPSHYRTLRPSPIVLGPDKQKRAPARPSLARSTRPGQARLTRTSRAAVGCHVRSAYAENWTESRCVTLPPPSPHPRNTNNNSMHADGSRGERREARREAQGGERAAHGGPYCAGKCCQVEFACADARLGRHIEIGHAVCAALAATGRGWGQAVSVVWARIEPPSAQSKERRSSVQRSLTPNKRPCRSSAKAIERPEPRLGLWPTGKRVRRSCNVPPRSIATSLCVASSRKSQLEIKDRDGSPLAKSKLPRVAAH